MRLAEHISEVEQRPSFAKHSIGMQITETADSIAANVSESHGRYHYEENRQCCYSVRGSLQKTRTRLQTARSRPLSSVECFDEMSAELIEIRPLLNGYIRPIGCQKGS